jgi:phosphomannomutase/phosphoglucomutase
LLSLVVLAAGLAIVAIGGTLLWNTLQANAEQSTAQAEAERQAAALEQGIRALRNGLTNDAVLERARNFQNGDATRDDLIQVLRDADVRNVLYLVNATEPFELTDTSRLPGGGFAALNMILEAGEQQDVPVQVHFAGTPDEYLAVVGPRVDDAEPAMVLWVALPVSMLVNLLEPASAIDGLVLRQRDAGSDVVLQSVGIGAPSGSPSIAIEGTQFELSWHRAHFIGPMGTGQLVGVFTVGVLLVALSVLRLRDSSSSALAGFGRKRPRSANSRDIEAETETPSPISETATSSRPSAVPPTDRKAEPESKLDSTRESKPAPKAPAEAEPTESSTKRAVVSPAEPEPPDEDDAEAPPPDLTVDGEPRRANTDIREIDASDLGGFQAAGTSSARGEAGDGSADEESNASGDDLADSTPKREERRSSPGLPPLDDDEDEQEAIGEMLRSLMDETEDAVAESDKFEIPAVPDEPATSPGEGSEPAISTPMNLPNSTIFRAYDIRGIVGETLDEGVAEAIGRAIGSEARERNLSRIAVARDGRLSGAALLNALSKGLMSTGMEVVDVGAVPTPVLYYAAQELGGGSGVMVTGSHNPPDYNGFKIVLGGQTLAGDAITALHTRLAEGRVVSAKGQSREARINNAYIERIANDIQLEKPLKVVADCGNGIAGAIAPRLLEAIGADVIPLYAEVDGTFPNHHPDPGDPTTLEDLRLCVRNFEADVGVAFDGDGDRLGVVGPGGEIIYPDRLMMLFARDVLSRVPGSEIIYDVKCSSLLAREIEEAGGKPVMARTGHSFIKAELKQRKAALAGEMSGHFFFAERWLGFDDGLYSAARLLEILAADTRAPGQVFGELPKAESTPELKIEMKEGQPHAFVKAFQQKASFESAEISTLDGVRADFADGFGLVRASNTTPVLVLRFEGVDKDALARIQGEFREAMLAVHPSLKLPF